jgi:hypothetical protein
MEFVKEAWAAGTRGVPGWYSREAMGMPFAADVQNFPWLPTRLPLLLFPPHAAYAPGVVLAAALAVVFTYLFARRLGLLRLAAASAGFAFAASGFFASRVMAGHLVHLEAYPALPLLLWLVERYAQSDAEHARGPLLGLALGAFCTALGGNPQLPFYALVLGAAYVLWRCAFGRAVRALFALALGCLATLVVWLPTLRLIARSARLLPLERPDNDVPFPLGRLAALFSPWRDGWPFQVVREPAAPFHGYSSDAVFWETSSYAGLLPWLAAAVLLVLAVRRRHVSRPAAFLAAAAAACAALSLAPSQRLFDAVHATIFRSAARLWCMPTLALALAFGALVSALWTRPAGRAFAVVLVGLHAWDLAVNAAPFARSTIGEREPRPRIEEVLATKTGSARVALDYNLPIAPTRRYDDAGFFASIHLATSYRAFLALARMPETRNIQYLSGARELDAAALTKCGVRFVSSLTWRGDLTHLLTEREVHLFAVDDPVPRAAFFPDARVRYWNESEMTDLLRDPSVRLDRVLLLPLETARAVAPAAPDAEVVEARWSRPSPDTMEVAVEAPSNGWLRVLESHDPGWSATLDGAAVPIVRSESFLMAVAVPSGRHEVRFVYRTPGRLGGALLSLVSLAGLLVLLRCS